MLNKSVRYPNVILRAEGPKDLCFGVIGLACWVALTSRSFASLRMTLGMVGMTLGMVRKTRLWMRLGRVLLFAVILTLSGAALAQGKNVSGITLPTLSLGFKSTSNPTEVVSVIKIVLLLTVLTLAPAIIILMTSFTRLVVVFAFLRQALGTQQMPPNQLIVGLALFLTFFIMAPAIQEINGNALQPYLKGTLSQEAAGDAAMRPLRKFMFSQTRDSDLALFIKMSKIETPKTRADVPSLVLIPAFIISELKTAFQIGFIIYLPFLVIDIVVASVLMAMGMMMVPPIVVSLPFKILIFVLVDGWQLIVGSLVKSFG